MVKWKPHLLDVTLQNRKQLAQFPPALCRCARLLDAVTSVRMNQFFRERFQTAPGGHDLDEDFYTVAVFVDHSFDGVKLADDLAHPDD